MRTRQLALVSVVLAGALLVAARARGAEISTPPIAAHLANTFLNCAIQNAGSKSGTARLQIILVPSGEVLTDSGDRTVAPGAGLTAGAVGMAGGVPPTCTNGDCPCPNGQPGEHCRQFVGTAYCRFITKESKTQYRAVGCVSSPATDPVSSPTCLEAR